MLRRTKVVLEVDWDDEKRDHPAGWDFNVLLECEWPEDAHLKDFEDEE